MSDSDSDHLPEMECKTVGPETLNPEKLNPEKLNSGKKRKASEVLDLISKKAKSIKSKTRKLEQASVQLSELEEICQIIQAFQNEKKAKRMAVFLPPLWLLDACRQVGIESLANLEAKFQSISLKLVDVQVPLKFGVDDHDNIKFNAFTHATLSDVNGVLSVIGWQEDDYRHSNLDDLGEEVEVDISDETGTFFAKMLSKQRKWHNNWEFIVNCAGVLLIMDQVVDS